MKNRFWNPLLKCFLIKKISVWKSENGRRKKVSGSLPGCWRRFGLRRTWVFFCIRNLLRGSALVRWVRARLRRKKIGPVWLCFPRRPCLTFLFGNSGSIFRLSFYCISSSTQWKAFCRPGCKQGHTQSKSSFQAFIILCTPGFMSCRSKSEPHFGSCRSARSKWSTFRVLAEIKLGFSLKGFWSVSEK